MTENSTVQEQTQIVKNEPMAIETSESPSIIVKPVLNEVKTLTVSRIGTFAPPDEVIEALPSYDKLNTLYRAVYAFKLIRNFVNLEPSVRPSLCSEGDLSQFHTVPYIASLKLKSKTEECDESARKIFNIEHNLFDYAKFYTSGTLGICSELLKGNIDIGINFYGGGSMARRQKTCFGQPLNDVVLGLLMLAEEMPKILYISIDDVISSVVEEAFYTTDRIFTLSFYHKKQTLNFDKVSEHPIDLPEGKSYYRIELLDHLDGKDFVMFVSEVIQHFFNEVKPDMVVFQASSRLLASDVSCPSNLKVSDVASIVSKATQLCQRDQAKLMILGGTGHPIGDTARMYAAMYLAARYPKEFSSRISEKFSDTLSSDPLFHNNPILETHVGNLSVSLEAEALKLMINQIIVN